MNLHDLSSFIDSLRAATTFEDAADVTVRAMLAAARAALAASRYAKRGRVLRGMTHLRPADGYRRLVVVDDAKPRGGEAAVHLPSASAWRWVAKHACSVCIDVPIGRVRAHKRGAFRILLEPGASGLASHDSVLRLQGREVTHLDVVPLRGRRGVIEGMIAIESDCPTAVGQDFVFAQAGELLELLADIAGPYLVSLPSRPAAGARADEHLPVIGATMSGLVEMLRVFAQQHETILLGGPTGAGKSRLARYCHEHSPRRGRAFEVLDLITVPQELQMAELFGWRRGAFTGAARDNPGAVARAEGGTLFIDEIDKLSLKEQAGLLHLLEERSYRPLGEGTGERRADVRFIIGSNVDLYELVQKGQFREDLYYRINVLPIQIPPLAERADEIPLWALHMVRQRHRSAVPDGEVRISAAAEELLVEQRWPGNLRQLDNVLRRAYAIALMAYGGAAKEILLEEPHVARALSYERASPRRPLLESLREAASAFVEEAEERAERGGGLDLDWCDALRGMVLGTAVKRLGGREAAFRLLGKAAQVQGRNHHKAMRREIERVEALYRELGAHGGSPFATLVEGEDT